MQSLGFSYRAAAGELSEDRFALLAADVRRAHALVHDGGGPGAEYLGWVDLPLSYDRDELARIEAAAARIREQAEVLVVAGVGGSYAGARAVIEALSHPLYNVLDPGQRHGPMVLFAGHNLSSAYLAGLLDALGEREVALNVISKSGATLETAVAFRFLRAYLQRRYGEAEARRRIYVTTDGEGGALRQLAAAEGYASFAVPRRIGGRYSVLTPVGLLPIAAAGIDVRALLAGAAAAAAAYQDPDLGANPCYRYAVARTLLYRQGKAVELLVSYEPMLAALAEWWKQLFGESEGKEGRGLYPASAAFTTDLHSLGQYLQEGQRHLIETAIWVTEPPRDLALPAAAGDDGLGFLAGASLHSINQRAREATELAHTDGGVPVLTITLPELAAEPMGQLLYFFEKACAMSGYLLGVNPFDQPGVEAYKKNMFALLGRPDQADLRAQLEARLRRR